MIALMGAAGNVGRKVADLLLEAGEEVRTSDLLPVHQKETGK